MAVMDEFKEEREAIKSAPFKKKAEYFWDYYKIHTCIVITVIIVIVALANTILTKTETVLSCAIINSTEDTTLVEELYGDTIDTLGIDEKKESITLDSTYTLNYEAQDYNHSINIQKIVTVVAAQGVDVIAADNATYGYLAYAGYLVDLEEVLSEEELTQYQDYLYYVDGAIIEEMREMDSASDEYPEYVFGDAEDMVEPIAVGIYADKDSMLAKTYGYADDGVIGIVTNTLNQEHAVAFLKLALEEK